MRKRRSFLLPVVVGLFLLAAVATAGPHEEPVVALPSGSWQRGLWPEIVGPRAVDEEDQDLLRRGSVMSPDGGGIPASRPLSPGAWGLLFRRAPTPGRPGGTRVPGEFESQEAILLAAGQLAMHHPDVLLSIVDAARRQVRVCGVVADDGESRDVHQLLSSHGLEPNSITLWRVPHNTMWIRDYGPIFVESDNRRRVAVDAIYLDSGRTDDDAVPGGVAGRFGAAFSPMPLALDGGNFLSNGEGICVTTSTTLDRNLEYAESEQAVRHFFRESFGSTRTVVLEALVGEPTGHVDMFATFTAPNTVLIGRCDPAIDPLNAQILDRNAATLGGLPTPRGPLRVERIPMPSTRDGLWRSYTNVVYANRVVLVPVYRDADQVEQKRVLNTFRRLLPGRTVVGIDCEDLIRNCGALHCVTANVPRMDRQPSAPDAAVIEQRSGQTQWLRGAYMNR